MKYPGKGVKKVVEFSVWESVSASICRKIRFPVLKYVREFVWQSVIAYVDGSAKRSTMRSVNEDLI